MPRPCRLLGWQSHACQFSVGQTLPSNRRHHALLPHLAHPARASILTSRAVSLDVLTPPRHHSSWPPVLSCSTTCAALESSCAQALPLWQKQLPVLVHAVALPRATFHKRGGHAQRPGPSVHVRVYSHPLRLRDRRHSTTDRVQRTHLAICSCRPASPNSERTQYCAPSRSLQ